MPRQHGYAVTLTAFVPSDPSDIDRLAQVAVAIQMAKAGDPGPLLALGSIGKATIKSQHRNITAAASPPNTAQADQDDRLRAEGKAEKPSKSAKEAA